MEGDLPHILVVDDDDRLRRLLRKFLSENGFLVATAQDAEDAGAKLRAAEFDMVVLDRMMPGQSGLEFAAELRGHSSIPILMLTAMAEPEERINGLESGVDDYLTKPFEPRELLLRINSILRRVASNRTPGREIRLGDVRFDPERGLLLRGDETLRLTDVETALLRALADRPGMILSRDDLIRLTNAQGGGRAIDVQVTRIRRKICDDAKTPRYLQTVRGQGYMLLPD